MFHYLMAEEFLESLEDAKDKVKNIPISNGWRGTNYKSFEPLPDVKLPLYIVADKQIREGKILEAMHGSGHTIEKARKSGSFCHEIFAELYKKSKDYVSSRASRNDAFGLERYLRTSRTPTIRAIMQEHYTSWIDVKSKLEKIWNYESHLLVSRLYFFLSNYPNWNPRNIAEHVFCFRSEYQFDGSKLHLSENSTIDLYRKNNLNVVIDIKTGKPKGYHYLTVVGYAMALESCPGEVDKIDVGCIMYLDFAAHDPFPRISCRFYPLLDSYRQDFLEELKEKTSWFATHQE